VLIMAAKKTSSKITIRPSGKMRTARAAKAPPRRKLTLSEVKPAYEYGRNAQTPDTYLANYDAHRTELLMDSVMPLFVPMLYVEEIRELAAAGMNAGMGGKMAAARMRQLAAEGKNGAESGRQMKEARGDSEEQKRRALEIYEVAKAWATLHGKSSDACVAAKQMMEKLWNAEKEGYLRSHIMGRKLFSIAQQVNKLRADAPDFDSDVQKLVGGR